MIRTDIHKPKNRSQIRQFIGREFFILKRKWSWHFSGKKYAKCVGNDQFTNSVFKHRSMIMRPLAGVDMQLQENKRTNLKLAIEKINGLQIKPNELFSLWKLVGRPTKEDGYLQGLVLKNGQIDSGIGGGLCQLGNLLFWIFAHSPLNIVERYRHGYDVFPDVNRKIPFGAGATLAYNYIDLQAQNSTKNTFSIRLWMDEEYLHGELLAEMPVVENYQVEERNHHIRQQFWGGYSRHNQIVQIKKLKNMITEKLLVENHAIMMYEPLISSEY